MEIRGVMLDISRDKTPTLESLKSLVKYLASMKYNHFELYMEGFAFAYPSFEHIWKGKETPLTGEEIRELDKLCKELLIDLVPNQNSPGHFSAWLATDEFRDLSETPGGHRISPLMKFNSTLDPCDPRSLELVTTMIDDLLPNFSSGYFNAGLDEPFELGYGKSRKRARETGIGGVYLEYTKKIYDLMQERGKRMLMWGDIVNKHPEITSGLPGDIILLDWGYEAEYPFDRNGERFRNTGIDFLVCPGKNS